eukprot:UN00520
MDDLNHPHKNKQRKTREQQSLAIDEAATCCCGKMTLRQGVIILSSFTILFSVLFIAFEAFFRDLIPWWIWGGTITGVVGGLFGCCGAIKQSFYKLTFAYLAWTICLCLWWAAFIVVEIVKFSKDKDWKHFWDAAWAILLFLFTGYTCYVINRYYRSIRPMGSKWNAFGANKPGYNAVE